MQVFKLKADAQAFAATAKCRSGLDRSTEKPEKPGAGMRRPTNWGGGLKVSMFALASEPM
jgi:hypothetical protein